MKFDDSSCNRIKVMGNLKILVNQSICSTESHIQTHREKKHKHGFGNDAPTKRS